MPFELRIALRYLTARRKQAFISVISAISVLGVVVGVMALMALGLMTGLQRGVRSRSWARLPHSIFPRRQGLRRLPRRGDEGKESTRHRPSTARGSVTRRIRRGH
jgi:ABC-type lipoprotein release transport system permease subunit